MTSQNASPSSKKSRVPVFIVVALVVVAAIGGGIWWFFSGDTPDKVNLDTAAGGVSTTASGSGSATSITELDGTWTVDTSMGDFDFNSATGTFAGYRIEEELAGIGNTEAVGRTGDVSGSFTIADDTVTEATIEVDLSTLKSNENMRDGRVKDALNTSKNPDATFVLSEPISLGPDAITGADVEVDAVGELTIHGVTNTVTFPLQARLVDNTVVVVGSLDITFADYDITVPTGMKVLSVKDHGTIEFQLLLTR